VVYIRSSAVAPTHPRSILISDHLLQSHGNGHASLRVSLVKWNSVACVAVSATDVAGGAGFLDKSIFYLLRV
jgi:hypothetical protein